MPVIVNGYRPRTHCRGRCCGQRQGTSPCRSGGATTFASQSNMRLASGQRSCIFHPVSSLPALRETGPSLMGSAMDHAEELDDWLRARAAYLALSRPCFVAAFILLPLAALGYVPWSWFFLSMFALPFLV